MSSMGAGVCISTSNLHIVLQIAIQYGIISSRKGMQQ